jgi:hypothetical protein
MTVTRRPSFLPLLALALVAGCSTAVAGTPAATTDPSSAASAPPASVVSAAIDPCSLLTGSDAQQLGLQSKGRDTAGGGRACTWLRTGQYTVGVEVFDNAGFARINTTNRTVTDHPVGSHDGRMVLATDIITCGVALEITKTSMVEVDVSGDPDVTQTCQLADQYAKLIELRLPAEQK